MMDEPRKTGGEDEPADHQTPDAPQDESAKSDDNSAAVSQAHADPSILSETANDQEPPDDEDALALTDEEKRIAELEEEAAELKDRALRAMADADNARKRAAREVGDSRKYGAASLARDVLTVADNLGRALQAVPEVSQDKDQNLYNLRAGVDMTLSELLQALERSGVQKVTPEAGERFDHNRHQAMFEVPTHDLAPGLIAEVVQDGYVLHDRLLRPAMVGVSKKPPEEAAKSDADSGGEDSNAA
ncbi:MAG: nucleotide exchange factor GrpE [Rhodospirillaceae bacterium]|nr:nucleotide exchange factor GrpE [Rhodospirillaceae bacterium]MCY4310573.1 nucleotide exchange factor GrpE [Rhodospirillaceae bacterium]